MTAILGYITDDLRSNLLSMFLASDGLVVWHTQQGDVMQTDFKKIHRFRNFLISFNGEVQFYQEFLNSIQQITKETSCIRELQDAINDIFPFDKFGSNTSGFSRARFSNIILLDIENRVLAHHFAGCVGDSNGFYFPFDFQILENNTLYHFGSKVSFMNEVGNKSDAFFIECCNCIQQTITKQIEVWETYLEDANYMFKGVGQLYSYFAIDQNKEEYVSNLGDII
jgi:hypothetical protein